MSELAAISQDKLSKAGAISEWCLCPLRDPWRVEGLGTPQPVAMDDGWGMVMVLRLSHASPNTSLPLYCLQVLRQCPSCSFRCLVTPLEDLPFPLSCYFLNLFLDTHLS